ncbi:hypothetical protein L2E82_24463 [Cichorium intybus]|uniref:Uncharacterized protein n=1 Tax=Cichorium intybus TaxID=13427 RepID=A0ACB9E101_CICIN|nr:hypothetical protein L2E82_24463 [Cichorium intybus]
MEPIAFRIWKFILERDCRICVWNANDGHLVHSLTGHSESMMKKERSLLGRSQKTGVSRSINTLFLTELVRGLPLTLKYFFEPKVTG